MITAAVTTVTIITIITIVMMTRKTTQKRNGELIHIHQEHLPRRQVLFTILAWEWTTTSKRSAEVVHVRQHPSQVLFTIARNKETRISKPRTELVIHVHQQQRPPSQAFNLKATAVIDPPKRTGNSNATALVVLDKVVSGRLVIDLLTELSLTR